MGLLALEKIKWLTYPDKKLARFSTAKEIENIIKRSSF